MVVYVDNGLGTRARIPLDRDRAAAFCLMVAEAGERFFADDKDDPPPSN